MTIQARSFARALSAGAALALASGAWGVEPAPVRPAPQGQQPQQQGAQHQREHGQPVPAGEIAIAIPSALREEHEAIHGELVRATKAKGKVGSAARELAAVLHDHFVREEQIALPPLGLVAPLARGEQTPAMREVLPMTDALRAELPRMLKEHEKIAAAARRLEQVARKDGNARVERLAKALQLHAKSEEELFYPAALLVGDVVRERSGERPERARPESHR